ncbi:hypothetical protein, partial [Pyxidicoccus fallax]|uniref:hypothetical protein n=1 Tax=Pyxidicoccus fallax TaxID=394095 RepID=UPI001C12FC66
MTPIQSSRLSWGRTNTAYCAFAAWAIWKEPLESPSRKSVRAWASAQQHQQPPRVQGDDGDAPGLGARELDGEAQPEKEEEEDDELL